MKVLIKREEIKNAISSVIGVVDKKQTMLRLLDNDMKQFECLDNKIIEINYPVNEYPEKVKSLSFDKMGEIAGRLWGIKGQYLMFDDGYVLNIRKHSGYMINLEA